MILLQLAEQQGEKQIQVDIYQTPFLISHNL